MKKLLLALCLIAFPTSVLAQTQLQRFEAGPRLIDGSQLNRMVDIINGYQGFATTANPATRITATTGTFSGAFTLTGTAASSGITCSSITPAAATDAVFFVATRAFRVVAISQIHSVAAGGTSTLQVSKDTGTDAPGAGTDLLSAAFDLNATANTVQTGSLVTTAGVTTLAAGNRLAIDFANAIQSSAGIVVTACMAPL